MMQHLLRRRGAALCSRRGHQRQPLANLDFNINNNNIQRPFSSQSNANSNGGNTQSKSNATNQNRVPKTLYRQLLSWCRRYDNVPFNPLPPLTLSPPQVNRLALKRLKDMRTFLTANELKDTARGEESLDVNGGGGGVPSLGHIHHPAHYAMYKDDVVVKENMITFPEVTDANELRAIIKSVYWLNNENTIAGIDTAEGTDTTAEEKGNGDRKEQISLAFDAMKSCNQLSAGELEMRRNNREKYMKIRQAGSDDDESPTVEYHVGQVIKHRRKKWRGVIAGWTIEKDKDDDDDDGKKPMSSLTTKQYSLPSPQSDKKDKSSKKKLPNEKVQYTVLVDINDARSDRYSYELEGDAHFLKSVTLESQADLLPVNEPCLKRIHNDLIKQYFTKFDARGHFVPNDLVAYVYPLDHFSHCKYDTGTDIGATNVGKETDDDIESAAMLEKSRLAIISGVKKIGRRLLLPLTESKLGKDEEIKDDSASMMISSLTSTVQSMLVEDMSSKNLDSAIASLAELYGLHVKINALLWTRNTNRQHKEHIDYSLGQVVKHKNYGFRGVVVAWDRVPRMDVSNWDGLKDVERPQEKPFYHIHPDVNDSIEAFGGPRNFRYVCQDNLELGPHSMKPLEFQIDLDHDEWKWNPTAGSYVPSAEMKFMYGEDLGEDETALVNTIRNLRKIFSDCLLEIRNGGNQEMFSMDDLFRQLEFGAENVENATVVEELVKEIWKESPNMDLRDQLDVGISQLLDGKHQSALDTFSAIVAYDPLYGEAWNKKATVHYMMGDKEKSIKSAEEALKIEPRNFQALAGIGLIEMDSSHYDKAIESFRKCLAVHPWLVTISSRLSRCMNKKDR